MKMKIWKKSDNEGCKLREFECEIKFKIPRSLESEMSRFPFTKGKRPPVVLELLAKKTYRKIVLLERTLWEKNISYQKRLKKTKTKLNLKYSFIFTITGNDSDSVVISWIKQDIMDALTESI